MKVFQWTNPHCWIQLLVEDPSGNPVEWGVELDSPRSLVRTGWKPEVVKPGDKMTLVSTLRRTAQMREAMCRALPPMVRRLVQRVSKLSMFDVMFTPKLTVMVFSNHEVRHSYTDGRSHPAKVDLWPTPEGDSIGHWKGNTLVVDTTRRQSHHD